MITYQIQYVYDDAPDDYEQIGNVKKHIAVIRMREAVTRAKAGEKLFLMWHRDSDGQFGYLNSDGGNDLIGRPWVS